MPAGGVLRFLPGLLSLNTPGGRVGRPGLSRDGAGLVGSPAPVAGVAIVDSPAEEQGRGMEEQGDLEGAYVEDVIYLNHGIWRRTGTTATDSARAARRRLQISAQTPRQVPDDVHTLRSQVFVWTGSKCQIRTVN